MFRLIGASESPVSVNTLAVGVLAQTCTLPLALGGKAG